MRDAGASDRPEQRWDGILGLSALALHPFLFAAASVLSLYASNLRQATFPEVISALATVLAAALVLFLLFGAALRSFGARAAILTSATLLAGLFYIEIVRTANRLLDNGLSPGAALAGVLAILAVLAIVLARVRVDLTWANVVLNGIALALFVPPAWDAAAYEWKRGEGAIDRGSVLADVPPEGEVQHSAVNPHTSEQMPDIYYFIFDRYASESVLAEHYEFDNTETLDFLRENGFYIASDSHSNYLKTAPSLASTFHMDYLDFLVEDEENKPTDWHPMHDMLKDHRVGRFLKEAGYRFIQVGAWWAPTENNRYADESYSFGFSEFNYIYLRKTIVPTLVNAVAPDSIYAKMLDWDNGQCQRVPRQMEAVKNAGSSSEPSFVFAHVLLPHGPYVFDSEGRCLPREKANQRSREEQYLGQLEYANLLIKDVVSALLNKDGTKPIIIIQADEGPYPERFPSSTITWHDATEAELEIKTGILNAYYFPDGDYSNFYQEITPVNTYRLLFNKYFGTDFERLPDRIYAFPDEINVYDFFDVTDVVRNAED